MGSVLADTKIQRQKTRTAEITTVSHNTQRNGTAVQMFVYLYICLYIHSQKKDFLGSEGQLNIVIGKAKKCAHLLGCCLYQL